MALLKAGLGLRSSQKGDLTDDEDGNYDIRSRGASSVFKNVAYDGPGPAPAPSTSSSIKHQSRRSNCAEVVKLADDVSTKLDHGAEPARISNLRPKLGGPEIEEAPPVAGSPADQQQHSPAGSCGPGPSSGSTIADYRMFEWEEDLVNLMQSGQLQAAIRRSAPSDGLIRCYVRRLKQKLLGGSTIYHMYLQRGDVFLLAARKHLKNGASNFTISTSKDDLGKDSEHQVCKLRANFVGTEYSLVTRSGSASAPTYSKEDMALFHKQTVLTAKGGPRMMLVAVPLPDARWEPDAEGTDSLSSCLELARKQDLPAARERQVCLLANCPPEWDDVSKSYTLNFRGRVKATSAKNFQLVHWDPRTDSRGSDVVLQFGKTEQGSDDYALDFTYPLNVLRSFAIALSNVDAKLCYAI